jgi:hypothetical protein
MTASHSACVDADVLGQCAWRTGRSVLVSRRRPVGVVRPVFVRPVHIGPFTVTRMCSHVVGRQVAADWLRTPAEDGCTTFVGAHASHATAQGARFRSQTACSMYPADSRAVGGISGVFGSSATRPGSRSAERAPDARHEADGSPSVTVGSAPGARTPCACRRCGEPRRASLAFTRTCNIRCYDDNDHDRLPSRDALPSWVAAATAGRHD